MHCTRLVLRTTQCDFSDGPARVGAQRELFIASRVLAIPSTRHDGLRESQALRCQLNHLGHALQLVRHLCAQLNPVYDFGEQSNGMFPDQ